MKDALNRPINLNDIVLVTFNSYLLVRIVLEIHPSYVITSRGAYGSLKVRSSDHIIIVPDGAVNELARSGLDDREEYTPASEHLVDESKLVRDEKRRRLQDD